METVSGKRNYADLEIADMMEKNDGDTVKTHGMIYSVKDMGDFGFVTLRKRNGLVQCVYNKGISQFEISDLGPEYSISVEGTIKKMKEPLEALKFTLLMLRYFLHHRKHLQ
jgi:Aspartyl/asparaginyl-tRNA synthetases